MLVNNGVRLGGGPMRFFGGANAASIERQKWGESGALRNMTHGCTGQRLMSIPGASSYPSAWLLANRSGDLACYTGCNGVGAASDLPLDMGKDLSGTAAGVGAALDALLALVVPLAGAAAGTGGADATLTGLMQLIGTAYGVGGTEAAMSLIVDMIGTAAGSGGGEAVLTALAHLEGSTATVSGEMTPEAVAAAVWQYLLGASAAGDLLEGAGAAGNPWLADLSGYTGDQAGAVLKRIPSLGKLLAMLGE